MKIALGLEYCGSNYSGWQKQKHCTSIQEHVENTLSKVADQTIVVQCAGRTDRGVHALHQVIHFETSMQREYHAWVLGGNVHLPDDISILWARPVDEQFNARFSALSRTYSYVILNRVSRPGTYSKRVTWECHPLDVERMKEAAAYLIGEHDFTSYRSVKCQANSPVRTIYSIKMSRQADFIFIEIEANAFLHHMVRNIAGVLIDIGRSKRETGWSKQVLDAKDRTKGGVTAPADGLYLKDICYPENFDIPVFNELNCPFAQ